MNNLFHGNGKLKLPDETIIQGKFEKGVIYDKGIIFFKNGDVYNGEIANNKIGTFGIMKYKNGDIYEGQFFEGMKYGSGKLTFVNGNIFKGIFKADGIEGLGKEFIENEEEYYEGEFRNAPIPQPLKLVKTRRHGKGIMINSKLELYNGMWDNGKFLGKRVKRGITISQYNEIINKLKNSKVDTRI